MHVWGQDCLWLCINIFFSGYASFPTSKLFVCCTERGCSSHWKWIFNSYPLLPLRALPRPPLLQNQLPLPLSLEKEIHGFNSWKSLTFLHGNLRMDVGLAIKKQQQTHTYTWYTIIPSTGAAETAVARKTNATEAIKRFL